MKQYEVQNGVRILDYFDEHYYPWVVSLTGAGDAALQARRLRTTRSLWDSTYFDESYISDGGPTAVQLIPRMRDWVAANYPGTKTAISEYNWGALDDLNGAIAQADVLGIFGREKLDMATLWAPPDETQPAYFAFRMYRNYDGTGKGFGETAVKATTSGGTCPEIGDAIPCVSVFGALRGSDTLTLMIINKSPSNPYTSTVSIAGFNPGTAAQAWRYSGANLNAIVQQPNQTVSGSGFTATFPASSVTLYVIPVGGGVAARPDTVGTYNNNGRWSLRYANSAGPADLTTVFGGDPSDLPVVGDWNGDGVDTLGIYRSSIGNFFLSDSNLSPAANYIFTFGIPGDAPFAGKWVAGATHDGVGVYRNSNGILYQANNFVTGYSDFFAIYGIPGDQGFAADWNNDGLSSIGVYRSSNTKWYLTNNSMPNGITYGQVEFTWPIGTARPVVGDWDGDGVATVGSYGSGGTFTLHSANANSASDGVFVFDVGGTVKPIAGKWTLSAAAAPLRNLIVVPGTTGTGGAEGSSGAE